MPVCGAPTNCVSNARLVAGAMPPPAYDPDSKRPQAVAAMRAASSPRASQSSGGSLPPQRRSGGGDRPSTPRGGSGSTYSISDLSTNVKSILAPSLV